MRALGFVVMSAFLLVPSVHGTTIRHGVSTTISSRPRLVPRDATLVSEKSAPSLSDLEKLITNLTAETYDDRKAAERDLEKLGPAAVVRLAKESAKGEDLESRLRAEKVLSKILSGRDTELLPEQYLCIVAYSFSNALNTGGAVKEKNELLRVSNILSKKLAWDDYAKTSRPFEEQFKRAMEKNEEEVYASLEGLEKVLANALKGFSRELGKAFVSPRLDSTGRRGGSDLVVSLLPNPFGHEQPTYSSVRREALPRLVKVKGLGVVQLSDYLSVSYSTAHVSRTKIELPAWVGGSEFPVIRPFSEKVKWDGQIPSATNTGDLVLAHFEKGFPREKAQVPAIRRRMRELCGDMFEP